MAFYPVFILVGGRFMSKKDNQPQNIIEITNEVIVNMIHEIRDKKVMLDFELAELYGYETKRFNEQIKNNIERFPDDFMFRLTSKEVNFISRSKKSTAIMQTKGKKGGRTSLPFAFTEQGIYMLITVLKGDVAMKQSITLIRVFKEMKDYINSTTQLSVGEIIELTNQTNENKNKITEIEGRLDEQEKQLQMVMENFQDSSRYKHFIVFKGQKVEANLIYQDIYSGAKREIIIIDDYIGLKTLDLLRICSPSIKITILSDNCARNKLTEQMFNEFIEETKLDVSLKPSNRVFHDRYIAIDYKTENEKLYHCSSSSKDGGNGVTEISLEEKPELFHDCIDSLL